MSQAPFGFQAFIMELKRRRVVRVALLYAAVAYAVLEAADLIIGALQLPEWLLSLLVITAFVGFPITVALSWLFDVSPEGIVRTRSHTSPTGQPVTWFSTGSIVVLTGASVAIAAGWWLTQATGAADGGSGGAEAIRSIAVLPFDNVGPDPENDYFADGLADELRSLLSRIGGLDVAARASSFQVHKQTAEITVVARELRVRAVLRGTVEKQLDRVRVTAELMSVDDGALWNSEYERLVDDIFEVQSQVASSIIGALELRLPQGELMPVDDIATTNVMAYDKYLWGRFNLNRHTSAGVRDAIDNFQMSVGFDSAYVPAWSALAESYAQALEFSDANTDETIAAGLIAAETALRLDSASAAARSALGFFRYQRYEWEEAAIELRRALGADPTSSLARARYAELLIVTDKAEQAVAEIRTAQLNDALSPALRRTAARVLAASGRVEESIREAQQAIQLDPDDPRTWSDMGFLFMAAGRFGDARNAFQRLAELTAADLAPFAAFVSAAEAYTGSGSPGALPDGLEELIGTNPGTSAMYLAVVGLQEEALVSLGAAVERRAFGLAMQLKQPSLDGLRADPGFSRLLAELGLEG